MRHCILTALILVVCSTPAYALDRGENDVLVRVADVGAGLCCIIVLPDADDDGKPEYIIYDAGNGSTQTINKIKELIPEGENIELLVLSHSDADHLAAVEKICDAYKVKRVLRTGFARNTAVWKKAFRAIKKEVRTDGCMDINLAGGIFPRGATFRIGDAFIQFVAGWDEPPEDFELGTDREGSEYRNAISIVIKLTFHGKSVLFTGDSIGREIDAETEEEKHKAAELNMVEWDSVIPLKSDVIIAPHHGGDNGSSTPFIEAVDPDFVVFSAGNKFNHPRKEVAERYIAQGVIADKMFRTDRGSTQEADSKEWSGGHKGQVHPDGDKSGDDDVDILLRSDDPVIVAYESDGD